jgi:hypothetical protein
VYLGSLEFDGGEERHIGEVEGGKDEHAEQQEGLYQTGGLKESSRPLRSCSQGRFCIDFVYVKFIGSLKLYTRVNSVSGIIEFWIHLISLNASSSIAY